MHNIVLGRAGEGKAEKFLREKGYKILERNWRFAKFGEIDIIAKEKDTICFIEVKTRNDDKFGEPYESVDKRKQFKLSGLAIVYLKAKHLMHFPARFDIISISGDEIRLFANAFSLNEKFTY